MAPLTDPERLEAYKDALSNWRFEGYVEFNLNQQAHDWVRRELTDMPLRHLAQLMHEYVESGGTVDEVRETRYEWSDRHEYHYDLRFPVHSKPVYIESRLICRLPFVPDEPRFEVVNVQCSLTMRCFKKRNTRRPIGRFRGVVGTADRKK